MQEPFKMCNITFRIGINREREKEKEEGVYKKDGKIYGYLDKRTSTQPLGKKRAALGRLTWAANAAAVTMYRCSCWTPIWSHYILALQWCCKDLYVLRPWGWTRSAHNPYPRQLLGQVLSLAASWSPMWAWWCWARKCPTPLWCRCNPQRSTASPRLAQSAQSIRFVPPTGCTTRTMVWPEGCRWYLVDRSRDPLWCRIQ